MPNDPVGAVVVGGTAGGGEGGLGLVTLEADDTTTVLTEGQMALVFWTSGVPGISGYYYLVVGDGESTPDQLIGAIFPSMGAINRMIDTASSAALDENPDDLGFYPISSAMPDGGGVN